MSVVVHGTNKLVFLNLLLLVLLPLLLVIHVLLCLRCCLASHLRGWTRLRGNLIHGICHLLLIRELALIWCSSLRFVSYHTRILRVLLLFKLIIVHKRIHLIVLVLSRESWWLSRIILYSRWSVAILRRSVCRILILWHDALLWICILIWHHMMIHRIHSIIEARVRIETYWIVSSLSHHVLHVLHLLWIKGGHVGLEVFEIIWSTVIEIELVHILHALHANIRHIGHLSLHVLHHLHVL